MAAARRERKIAARVGPLALLAVLAFVAGMIVARDSAEVEAAERFAAAWVEQDFEAMYAELTPEAQERVSAGELERAYAAAQRTSTLSGLGIGEARGPLEQDGVEVVAVEIEAETRSFRIVSGEIAMPVSDGAIAWEPHLVFPGLRPGERLERETTAPERAPILARDGTEIASGPASGRRTPGAAGVLVGEMGAPPTERARAMARQGFPEGTPAGNSGLELAFDGHLAGTPGGELLAVSDGAQRTLAAADPVPGKPVRTTIDPEIQQAAVEALGARFGGVAAIDARNGEVRGLAGIAFSAPQPPGSTFKIITTVAALEAGAAEPGSEYAAVESAPAGGREIANAHDESCGGTLVQAFARSCNTVFAPLGVEVGAEPLLETAERFGFNSPTTLYNDEALAATQPPASTIPDPIDGSAELAVTAIGQGRVLATPLSMASVAQTIANGGVRSPTPIVKNPTLRPDAGEVEVTSAAIARQVREMMVEVVRSGTGTAAAVPGTTVAGKSGTAELGPKPDQEIDPDDPDAEPELEVDAWFTAFAPARKPRLAVAVMIVNADGDGGVVAAPIARQVLAAGLPS